MHVGRPAIRALRATAFTVMCVLASAALHILVSGTAIQPGPLTAAATATWAGAYAVGRRPRGWPELLALCALSQYGMHQLFAAPDVSISSQMLRATNVSHDHDGGTGMLLIHLAVALFSSWWLARGEAALAALLHLNAIRLACAWILPTIVRAPVVMTRARRSVPAWPDKPHCRLPALLAPVMPRRGPPAPLTFA
ncbi:hypothetical protein [Nonomuraea glycinis]|uniref:hypothetical protein n=1 Tax=Nonomuraea glycinis TaxID=2047744 RepID=UPI002E0F3409|nr:hypothetical protein OHA68_28410 [Nonomuraea glycinis]